jgi:hypothetical protein
MIGGGGGGGGGSGALMCMGEKLCGWVFVCGGRWQL